MIMQLRYNECPLRLVICNRTQVVVGEPGNGNPPEWEKVTV